ncbi:amidohydrolase family protein [Cellulomonas fengjieae]|uniref:Amidohydrolase family protein n=1 Tax=Cellulomonas fengjieae TaxID=2819978 RepID=A0ABS3SG47_9CELL|nr:amidohydrolase family protein [Cellulomonas fengjieae]MBO3084731.1 amidohydrolase family protein [Cellulomonas fengjieae]QVI66947.1 amidohydrolase family protein [Cellulomonas fengjieae]
MIDSLVVLGENLFGPSLSVSDCLLTSAQLGIEGVVAAPARGRDYVLPAANDRLAADADGMPGVARLARVDPLQGTAALSELRRCLDELHCSGVFLNPDEEVFAVQDAEAVVRVAADAGVPVVVVAGVPHRSEPLQILDLAARVPEARLILTSGGQINIAGLSMVDAWAALTAAPNISVLSNGEYRQDFLERIPRELGAERLLFASFAPYYEQPFEAARIRNIGYSAGDLDAVCHDNARRAFALTFG